MIFADRRSVVRNALRYLFVIPSAARDLADRCIGSRFREVTPYYVYSMSEYYVYIMTNQSRTLYTGMTNNLFRRVAEHKEGRIPGFTQKYNIKQLIYYETFTQRNDAIDREKEIKSWRREKKIALIEEMNPQWEDLSLGWF